MKFINSTLNSVLSPFLMFIILLLVGLTMFSMILGIGLVLRKILSMKKRK